MLQLDEIWSLGYDGKNAFLQNSQTKEIISDPLDGVKIRAGRGTQTAESLVRQLCRPYAERTPDENEIYDKFLGIEDNISSPKQYPVTTVRAVDEFGKPYVPPVRKYDKRPVVL